MIRPLDRIELTVSYRKHKTALYTLILDKIIEDYTLCTDNEITTNQDIMVVAINDIEHMVHIAPAVIDYVPYMQVFLKTIDHDVVTHLVKTTPAIMNAWSNITNMYHSLYLRTLEQTTHHR